MNQNEYKYYYMESMSQGLNIKNLECHSKYGG